MALEDRCSPQSANSPPGLPQSPQSNQHPFHGHNGVTSSSPCPTTSMLMLINNVIDSKTKLNAAMDYETSSQNGSLKSPDMSPSQLLSSIASKNLFNIQNQLMFQQQQQHNNSDKQNSPPATPMRTDDEDEDEDEIDIENDTPKGHNTSGELNNGSAKFLLPSPASPASSQHSPSPQISSPSTPTSTTTPSGNLKFSISQILSDNFGIESKFHQHAMASAAAVAAMQLKSGQHPLQQYPFYHPAMAGMLPNGAVPHPHFNLPPHHPLLFRPYDALDAEIRNQQAAAAAAAAAQQKMKNNFSSLFSSFHQQQQQQTKSTRSSLEDFCDSKLSQLSNGGVGNGISSSNGSGAGNGPMRPVSSSSSSSSVNNSINKLTTTTASIKSPSGSSVSGGSTLRPDSGVDSSDDTKSETGSTKDENGQAWPAWIYCTRYSDRPSSGKRRIGLKIRGGFSGRIFWGGDLGFSVLIGNCRFSCAVDVDALKDL